MNREDCLALTNIADEDLTPDQARIRATNLLVQHLGQERAAAFSNATMDAYFAQVQEPDVAAFVDEQAAVMELVRAAWTHLLARARDVERGYVTEAAR